MKKKRKAQSAALPGPRFLRRLFPKLKRVVDSKEAVEVQVQQRDCDAGRQSDARECALAKAAKREFHAEGAVIGLSRSYIVKGDTAVRFQTPVSVQREITSFDRHKDFAPGRYRLSAVNPTQKLGEARPHGSGSRNSKRITHRETVRVRVLREEAKGRKVKARSKR